MSGNTGNSKKSEYCVKKSLRLDEVENIFYGHFHKSKMQQNVVETDLVNERMPPAVNLHFFYQFPEI